MKTIEDLTLAVHERVNAAGFVVSLDGVKFAIQMFLEGMAAHDDDNPQLNDMLHRISDAVGATKKGRST